MPDYSLDQEFNVSGNIYGKVDTSARDGESFIIRPNNQGWGLPTCDIDPEDLRALADRIEAIRKTKASSDA